MLSWCRVSDEINSNKSKSSTFFFGWWWKREFSSTKQSGTPVQITRRKLQTNTTPTRKFSRFFTKNTEQTSKVFSQSYALLSLLYTSSCQWKHNYQIESMVTGSYTSTKQMKIWQKIFMWFRRMKIMCTRKNQILKLHAMITFFGLKRRTLF